MASVLAGLVWIAGTVLAFLLGFRFALKAFGANSEAGFAQFVYGASDVFLAPFRAIFSTDQVEGSVFEWSTLVAIAVYLLVAWAIVSLIRVLAPRRTVSAFEESEVLNDQGRVVQLDPDKKVQREDHIVDRDRPAETRVAGDSDRAWCDGVECPA
ncbi:MAG: YggT family protein [Thermoleophilia bacterium]